MSINAAYNATKTPHLRASTSVSKQNTTATEAHYKKLMQNVFKYFADNEQYDVLERLLHECNFSYKQQGFCLSTLSEKQRIAISKL